MGRRRTGILLLAPVAFLWGGLFALPLGIVGRFSFYEALSGGQVRVRWVLDNYQRFLGDPFYLGVLGTTLGLGLVTTALCVVLGYPVAYALARTRSSSIRAGGIVILLIPLMTSVVVRSYGWMIALLFVQEGLNEVMRATGLSMGPIRVMFTRLGVVVALTEVLLPLMVLSLFPVIQTIDRGVEEASLSLGASPLTTFRRIVVPLSWPGLVSGGILVFVLAINAFATPRLVGGASVQVMSTVIYSQALNLFNWPFGAAIAIVLLVLVLGLTGVQDVLLRPRGLRAS